MDFNEITDKERIERALQLTDFEIKLGKLDLGINTEMTREFSEEY